MTSLPVTFGCAQEAEGGFLINGSAKGLGKKYRQYATQIGFVALVGYSLSEHSATKIFPCLVFGAFDKGEWTFDGDGMQFQRWPVVDVVVAECVADVVEFGVAAEDLD